MAVAVSRLQKPQESSSASKLGGLLDLGGTALMFVNPAAGAAVKLGGRVIGKKGAEQDNALNRRAEAIQTAQRSDPLTQLREAQDLVAGLQDPELRQKFGRPLIEAEFKINKQGVA